MTAGREAGAHTGTFRELEVWQKAMKLARDSYAATDAIPKCEMFRLRGEIRRIAMSVQTDIARGHRESSDTELSHSLGHALESLSVLEAEIKVAEAAGYLEAGDVVEFHRKCEEVAAMVQDELGSLGGHGMGHRPTGRPKGRSSTPGHPSAS